MRLFVSVDLPDRLTEPIRRVQSSFGDPPGLRFTQPDQAHITLKFLGDTDEAALPDLESALEDAVVAAGVTPFEATFGGLGAFPSEDYIRVVWLGTESGAEPLTRVHETIESATIALGYDPESHDFTPHITLARMEHAGGKEDVQHALRTQNPTVGTMDVTEVRLKESVLGPDGPTYSTRRSFPLPSEA